MLQSNGKNADSLFTARFGAGKFLFVGFPRGRPVAVGAKIIENGL
jgi:hypothetical protein